MTVLGALAIFVIGAVVGAGVVILITLHYVSKNK
jgi:hypothetical protein